MTDTWTKVKIWTKLVVLALVILFVVIFVVENYSHEATVWFFGGHEMSVLETLSVAFALGVMATLLARPAYRTLGQIAQLRSPPAAAPLPPAAAPVERVTPPPADKP